MITPADIMLNPTPINKNEKETALDPTIYPFKTKQSICRPERAVMK
jgi:hypothetical protein